MDNITFEKLNPTSEADVRVYEDAFDFVFSNKDIKNVAISGAYGAGKSSVLESYKKKHEKSLLSKAICCFKSILERIKAREFNIRLTNKGKKRNINIKKRKYVHISLAHFEDVKTNETEEKSEALAISDSNKSFMSQGAMLEGKILNQLIHQIPAHKIPQTHFRVKKTISWLLILLYSLVSCILLVSLSHLIFFDLWKNYLESLPSIHILLEITINPYSRLISGTIFGVASFLFLYTIIKAQINKNIVKKLNVNGTEIEIFENTNESYFDKYLNEVLYLFEQIDADVIVFEDIDRYDDIQIFERLREVNTLVNLHPKRKRKEPLRFFYMLRDDIFESKDRSKFFDFIIPVVPVVDGSNAFNQFKTHLSKNNIYEKFDSSFLQGVARYVDEMRLLKNISNEFLIYFNRMAENLKLNHNKMFAMIIYKNLFPSDFCELQLGRGYVACLLNNKLVFAEEEIKLAEKRIDEIIKIEETKSQEIAHKQSEIEDIFKIKIHQNYRSRQDWPSYLPSSDKSEYERRVARFKELSEDRMLQLQKERVELEEKIRRLRTSKLSEIITRDNAQRVFAFVPQDELGQDVNFDKIRANPYFSLLKYLIWNGYIDETYSDYMTYFYGNSLSNSDKNFLLSVTDKDAKEYTYELRDPELVFKELRLVDFDEEETLNFSLFGYLITKQGNSEQLKHLILQLKNKKKYDFVYQYYSLNANIKELVVVLNDQWPTLFAEMLKNAIFTTNIIRRFVVDSLQYCTQEMLEAMNGESRCLTEYISADKSFLNIKDPNVENIVRAFSFLGVKFHELDYESSHRELFTAVYTHNLYELNYANIALMIITLHDDVGDDEIQHKSYTLISKDKSTPIFSYIDDNFTSYMNIVLENCNGKINDDDNVACDIINDERLEKEQVKKYIDYLSVKIVVLNNINEKSYWSQLLEKSKIKPSWQNILLVYFYEKKISSELIALINSCDEEFSEDFLIGIDDSALEKLSDEIIVCNDIDNDKYISILNTLAYSYDKFEVKGLSNDKVKLLISKCIINLNKDTLVSFRDNYPDLTLTFIKANTGKYLKLINATLFSYDEMLDILNWDIDDREKIELISLTDEPISIIDKNYSDTVAIYILENNCNFNDMKKMLSEYDRNQSSIDNFVLTYAKLHVNEIVEKQIKISQNLRDEILSDQCVDLLDKVYILVHTITEYTKSEITSTLLRLGMVKVAEVLMDNKHPNVPINDENELLLEAFEKLGWILGYEENPNRPDCYKIKRAKKPVTV